MEYNRYYYICAIITICVIARVYADNYQSVEYDVVNTNWKVNTGGEVGMYGMQVDVNRTADGMNVSLSNVSTMTRSCLYYSNNQSQIGSCQTLVNRRAQYNFTISSGQSFRIMFDNNGATYTRTYQDALGNFKGRVIGNITLERRWYFDGATWFTFGSDETTYESLGNVTLYNLGSSPPPTNTCTAPASGVNWTINLSDYCNITTNVERGGATTFFSGSGVCQISANVTNTKIVYNMTSANVTIFKAGSLG